MIFKFVRLKIGFIAYLFAIIILNLSCQSFATDGGNICAAFIDGIESTITVVNQAFDETQALTEQAAEEERQRLADLGYPEGYDSDDPVGMGEVDPWEAYEDMQAEEMDRAMAEDAMRAWEEYNEPIEHDISDEIIKP